MNAQALRKGGTENPMIEVVKERRREHTREELQEMEEVRRGEIQGKEELNEKTLEMRIGTEEIQGNESQNGKIQEMRIGIRLEEILENEIENEVNLDMALDGTTPGIEKLRIM